MGQALGASSSGLPQFAPNQIIVGDAASSGVNAGRYSTIGAAITAAAALTPSATKRVQILISPGVYAGCITAAEYVDLIGLGYVEVTSTTANQGALNACSNIRVQNIYFNATAGSGSAGIRFPANASGVWMQNVRANCAGTDGTDGMVCASDKTLEGDFYDCVFTSIFDAISINPGATGIRFWNCRGIGTGDADDNYRTSGMYVKGNGNGVIECYNCHFESTGVTNASSDKAYGVLFKGAYANTSILRLYNCRIKATGTGTGSAVAVQSEAPTGKNAAIEAYNCTMEAISTGAGDAAGFVTVDAGNPTLAVVGGSLKLTNTGGSSTPITKTNGTLTVNGTLYANGIYMVDSDGDQRLGSMDGDGAWAHTP